MNRDDGCTRITGEGSIEEVIRGKKYRIRLRIPPKEIGGKSTWSPMLTINGSKKEARDALEALRDEQEQKINDGNAGLTVGSCAKEFEDRRESINELSPLTLKRDQVEIKHLDRYFRSELIEELTPAKVSKAYARARKDGLSPDALFKMHVKLRQILDQAVVEEIITRNPCAIVQGIRRPERAERHSLTAEEAKRLARDLKESKRTGRVVAVWLALATGVRRGEALGLTWEHVDLEKGNIRIEKQLDEAMRIRSPKSKMSRRTLSIDDGTKLFLSEWKQTQSELFFEGEDVPESCPVCTNTTNPGFIRPETFDRWRRRFFVREGLGEFLGEASWTDKNGITRHSGTNYRGLKLHELRHTQATLLIGSGEDLKTVQHRLGHSSATTTMNVYAHVIEENDRKAADAIGGIMDL